MDRLDLHILKHLMLLTIKDYALVLFESLYVEANEPPLDLRRLKLTLQYIVYLKQIFITQPKIASFIHFMRVCMTKTKYV